MTMSESKENTTHAEELRRLLAAVEPSLLEFVAKANLDLESSRNNGAKASGDAIIQDLQAPAQLYESLKFDFPAQGEGMDAFKRIIQQLLHTSVNIWHPGFLAKLYSSPSPVGVVAELIVAVLNTNVHVYKASPALTVVEKKTARALAAMFELQGPRAGGFVQPGGSTSNLSAMVIARNVGFPGMKEHGCFGQRLVVFASGHCHYSVEKAAQIIGLGSKAVWKVPTDRCGRMLVSELEVMIQKARDSGFAPLMVAATSGTTVFGSYDPLLDIGRVCKRERIWLHVDASWGGAVIFSQLHRSKMEGVNLADSVTFNPHKMLKAPVTCSFLLTSDVQKFWQSNTLPASYLFHGDEADDDNDDEAAAAKSPATATNGIVAHLSQGGADEQGSRAGKDTDNHWDIADMTLQCGRRSDALKFALDWQFRGSAFYERQVDEAFAVAAYLAELVNEHPNLILASERPPPCLQVCFYWAHQGIQAGSRVNGKRTPAIAHALVGENLLVDYAAGDDGLFLRVVVNRDTDRRTVEYLVDAVDRVGSRIESAERAGRSSNCSTGER